MVLFTLKFPTAVHLLRETAAIVAQPWGTVLQLREFLIPPEEGGKVEDLDLTIVWGMVSITQD